MTAKKPTHVTKKPARRPRVEQQAEVVAALTVLEKARKLSRAVVRRTRGLLSRRPHRSFRRTRRRDYVRPLRLPGYWSLTNHVRKTLWQHKKLFGLMAIVYGAFTIALVGIASQDTYTELSNTLRSTGDQVLQGDWNELGKASLVLATGVTGAFNTKLTEVQQIYAVILLLFVWLTTVWLLRAVLVGQKPKLRDGLYHAGAPVMPTFLVALVFLMQLLPIAIAVIAFGVASVSGLLAQGIEAMLFWMCALLLTGLSVYWVTSTFIALVIVTLPGMYPMQAIRTAGDLVIGRRLRILLRILWLSFTVALGWIVVMVPIILFDTWLKGVLPAIQWLPLVPAALLVMGTLTAIWTASYIYLLYRRIVNDDAAPA